MAKVRQQELLLARDRALLADQELEISHQIADAIREMQGFYVVSQTAFNRRVSAKQQVEAVEAAYEAGTATLDLLLDAQRRLADADIEYYRSLTNYNLSIATIHLRKNSLLEYNGINLAEGPWPCKAYFDAHRLARQRDASTYLNYGMTQPRVFSRGPTLQQSGGESSLEPVPTEAAPGQGAGEEGSPMELPAPESKPGRKPAAPEGELTPPAARRPAAPGPAAARRGPRMAAPAAAPAVRPVVRPDGRPAGRPLARKFDWGDLELDAPDAPSPAARQTSHHESLDRSADESHATTSAARFDRPATGRARP
jgi:hypothetical protein